MFQYYQTEAIPCEYISAKSSRYFVSAQDEISPEYLDKLLSTGFRRYGKIYARQDCPECNLCKDQSLELGNFRWSKSLKRVRKKNADLQVEIEPIFCDARILEIYNAWQENRSAERKWKKHLYTEKEYFDSFKGIPPLTRQLTVRDATGLIIAVSMIDIGHENLNAHYTFYDIAQKHRSLGSFCVTEILIYAEFLDKKRVFLGPFNKECQSLLYKDRFGPANYYDVQQHSRQEVCQILQEPYPTDAWRSPVPTRWAIVGSGWMAQTMLQTLESLKGCTVESAVTRNPNLPAALYQSRSEIALYPSVEELLETNPPQILYIASPHSEHFHQARKALEAGVAVLVEKPACLKVAQWRHLSLLSMQKNTLLCEALWTRFFPFWDLFHSIPQQIDMGELEFVEADFQIEVPPNPNHRLFNKELGGGALWDLGIYPLALFDLLFEKQIPSNIEIECLEKRNGVDTHFEISMEYSCLVSMRCSIDRTAPQEARLHYSNGTLTIPDFFHPSYFCWNNGSSEVWLSMKKLNLEYSVQAIHFLHAFSSGHREVLHCTQRDTERLLSLLGTLQTRFDEF